MKKIMKYTRLLVLLVALLLNTAIFILNPLLQLGYTFEQLQWFLGFINGLGSVYIAGKSLENALTGKK